MNFSLIIVTLMSTYATPLVDAFNVPKDPSNVGRRDVMESITNVAFGLATGSVITMTPLPNYDLASAADATIAADAVILMDGTTTPTTTTTGWVSTPSNKGVFSMSSPTNLYLAQLTPKQKIAQSKNVIQTSWFTYIDASNWSTLTSSWSTENSIIRNNANTIVTQNPNNPTLVTRRTAMFAQLDSCKSAFDAKNKSLSTSRTLTLVTRISEFLAAAP